MSVHKVFIVLCLLGYACAFSTLFTFPDYTYNGGTTVVTQAVPNSITAGTGMALTLRAIGYLNEANVGPFPGTYIGIKIDNSPDWIWLDEVEGNDPFTSYVTDQHCDVLCGFPTTSTPDYGAVYGVVIGYYLVPYAVAASWVTDGSLTITATWGTGVNLLIGPRPRGFGYTTVPDYFSVTVSFNAGSVVGDPHVNPLYVDSFELLGEGIYTFFADDQLTVNARSTEPYRGFFLTEVAVIFDNHEGTSWVLYGAVDDVYEPHLYFNGVEILPGTFLLDGNLRFMPIEDYVLKNNVQYFEGAANPGYLYALCHLEIPGSGFILIRVGVDGLAGGFFELIVNPVTSHQRGVQGGMLMMTEETRDTEGIKKFAIENIFTVPQMN